MIWSGSWFQKWSGGWFGPTGAPAPTVDALPKQLRVVHQEASVAVSPAPTVVAVHGEFSLRVIEVTHG